MNCPAARSSAWRWPARSINRPKLLLLDEPLAALDAKLKESVQLELIGLQKEIGVTFVYVTHDQGEALALSHRIAVMNQGRVEQIDEPSKIYGFPEESLRRRLHRPVQPARGRNQGLRRASA